ncbi:pyrroloquinoline quinone biosynthesis peptide chaperone PqqD [Neptunomonas antarctica]|nr:pyrroloquinoline quinone biosynthesis peptide chaperone PqqD [Neptunomonas antarctica]
MSNLEMIPELEKMFRFQWEEAQQCYVLLYPEGMVKLNGPAGEILSQVDGQRSLAQIIELLVIKYPEAEDLDKDVLAFIDDALQQHWIRGAV